MPPKIYETIIASGYHHLFDLYTLDHQIIAERGHKERAAISKGIPGIQD